MASSPLSMPHLAALAALVALGGAACGSGGSSADRASDPVATAEDPGVVLANAQYPQLDAGGLKRSWLVDTGDHLTHVLSFVDGLDLDGDAAAEALRYFERLRQDVDLEVQSEPAPLTFRVRPRNYPQRYVVVVPDGVPLPAWTGRQEGT